MVSICETRLWNRVLFQRWPSSFSLDSTSMRSFLMSWNQSMSGMNYRLYLFYALSPKKQMSYKTHYDAYKAFLEANGINSSKVTHITRPGGTQSAAANAASDNSIHRLGLWANGTMEEVYMNGTFPMEAIRAVSNWSADGKSYWLPRATAPISESLRTKLFPMIGEESNRQLQTVRQCRSIDTGSSTSFIDTEWIAHNAITARNLSTPAYFKQASTGHLKVERAYTQQNQTGGKLYIYRFSQIYRKT